MKACSNHLKALRTILAHRKYLLLILFPSYMFLSPAPVFSGDQTILSVFPSPVVSSEYFPCSKCHNPDAVMDKQKVPGLHKDIPLSGHIDEQYGCFGCHDKVEMNRLRLFNGNVIELSASSELCGQCHSTNYRLWRSGLHGKVFGMWNGPKKISPCASCHDPHRPGYGTHSPMFPPAPPEKTLRWKK